jgi:probable rRNA maturation factor
MSVPESSTVTFRRAPAGLRREPIERFARKLQREVAHGRAFDCLISGDAELRRLNRIFRGEDHPTDVLSFPSIAQPQAPGIRPPASGPLLGDIAISLPRARAQAREFGHRPEQEIRILMLHGVLHLLGMDHASGGGRMARAEKRWRARLGLPHGLIERGLIERGLIERGLSERVQP